MFWISSIQIFATGSALDGIKSVTDWNKRPLQVVVIGWISGSDQRVVVFWISSVQVLATGSTANGKEAVIDRNKSPVEVGITLRRSGSDQRIVMFRISSVEVFATGSAFDGVLDIRNEGDRIKIPLQVVIMRRICQ